MYEKTRAFGMDGESACMHARSVLKSKKYFRVDSSLVHATSGELILDFLVELCRAHAAVEFESVVRVKATVEWAASLR